MKGALSGTVDSVLEMEAGGGCMEDIPGLVLLCPLPIMV